MKKLRNIISWLLIGFYIIVILGFISEKHSSVLCNHIDVHILDSGMSNFISSQDVIDMLKQSDLKLLGEPIETVNTNHVEVTLLMNGIIKTSEVYITENGELNIEITQREPVVRVINKNNLGYYLDNEGTIIPVSEKCSPHVLVANGFIHEPFKVSKTKNIYDNYDKHIYYDLVELVKFIHADEFWNSQIVQIYVNENQEFELIPRVGAHIILFGDITDYREKFDKLYTLYTEWLNKNNWNEYLYINLKYKNQVVCTKT